VPRGAWAAAARRAWFLEAADRGDELALGGQVVRRLDRLHALAFEVHDDAAPLQLGAGTAQREQVVPPVGVEGVGQQRRAEHVAHLQAREARADERHLFLRDGVALHDVDAVGCDDAEEAVAALQRIAAGGQQQGGQREKQTGRGEAWHGQARCDDRGSGAGGARRCADVRGRCRQ
jgi:hypothetical protein